MKLLLQFGMATIACLVFLRADSYGAHDVLAVIPEAELAGSGPPLGEISRDGLKAFEFAAHEVTFKWKVDWRDFKSVTVGKDGNTIRVYFSNRELDAEYTGSAGLPRPIEVTMDAATLRVMRSIQEP